MNFYDHKSVNDDKGIQKKINSKNYLQKPASLLNSNLYQAI